MIGVIVIVVLLLSYCYCRTFSPLALFPVFKGQGNDNYLTMISQFQPDNSSFLITYLEGKYYLKTFCFRMLS